jgi:hypothetical protein
VPYVVLHNEPDITTARDENLGRVLAELLITLEPTKEITGYLTQIIMAKHLGISCVNYTVNIGRCLNRCRSKVGRICFLSSGGLWNGKSLFTVTVTPNMISLSRLRLG